MLDEKDRIPNPSAATDAGTAIAGRMQAFVEELQRVILDGLERLDDGRAFRKDRWERPGGGGGITAVLAEGRVFEKAGVNTSAVYGELPKRMTEVLGVDPHPFFATGLSLVIHPRNPHVPTVHANFRYFGLGEDLADPIDQWFGGGADLTPYYPVLEDARHFHRVWKDVCDAHKVADYEHFKRQCDEYFYLPHREEARGIGGIFFDYMRDTPEATFAFVKEAGASFMDAYVPIVKRRCDEPYGERERAYQAVRRGRYVEFNLLYDRGTKFGIETQGRTESILMSLPPAAHWHYDWHADSNSPEERALWYFEPRDWLAAAPDDAPG
ncbi:MAG: oxygen-dependent coproporphyrinogen oxidase [Rhodothermales bacterium]